MVRLYPRMEKTVYMERAEMPIDPETKPELTKAMHLAIARMVTLYMTLEVCAELDMVGATKYVKEVRAMSDRLMVIAGELDL